MICPDCAAKVSHLSTHKIATYRTMLIGDVKTAVIGKQTARFCPNPKCGARVLGRWRYKPEPEPKKRAYGR